MESSDSGLITEPNSNSNLSLEDKREIVYQISQNPENAPEILNSWSRKELLELICIEMGKERKYSGLTKPKMINHLLNLVSKNINLENSRGKGATSRTKRKSIDVNGESSRGKGTNSPNGENLRGKDANSPNGHKRKSIDVNEENLRGKNTNSPNGHKRKSIDVNEENSRGKNTSSPNGHKRKSIDVNGETSRGKNTNSPTNGLKRKTRDTKTLNSRAQNKNPKPLGYLCKNAACKAQLNEGDIYCKRCSCCVCYKFDENKDPSLWLECNSDPPFSDESCGATWHLMCALKHERAGIMKSLGSVERLDLGFYCVFCGKVNSLLGCLRKQILTAINARRVESLCERLSLSRKILKGTQNYRQIENFIKLAVTKLKKEVGPLDRVCSANVARGGIVNRLNCGVEVQKLCVSALELLEKRLCCHLGFYDNDNDNNNKDNSNSNNDDNNSNSNNDDNNNSDGNDNGDNNNNQDKHQDSDGFEIQFGEITDSSIELNLITKESMFEKNIIGCSVWQTNCNSLQFPEKTDYLIIRPETKILVTGLNPATRYLFKACPFSSKGELGKFEANGFTKTINGSSLTLNGSSETLNESSLPLNGSSKTLNGSSLTLNGSSETLNGCTNTNSDLNGSGFLNPVNGTTNTNLSPIELNFLKTLNGSTNTNLSLNGSDFLKNLNGSTNTNSSLNGSDFLNPLNGSANTNSSLNGSDFLNPLNGSANTNSSPNFLKTLNGSANTNSSPTESNFLKTLNGSANMNLSLNGSTFSKPDKVTGEERYEYCVRVIRWLESENYMEREFRVKFLTWFSVKASEQERRIVGTFIDVLLDDPNDLVSQLLHSFRDRIVGNLKEKMVDKREVLRGFSGKGCMV